MNPSTYDILAGIHAAPGSSAVVLPNSPNVIMAAERAAELSEKQACVVPTRSQQAALAVLLAFDPAADAARTPSGCARRSARLRTAGSRGPRARTRRSGSRVGDAVGYSGEDLIAWGEPGRRAARDAARGHRGLRARHVHRRRRARRCGATRSSGRCRRASSSTTTRAASPRGGGSSAPSKQPVHARGHPLPHRHPLRRNRRPDGRRAALAPLRSLPRPSRLREPLAAEGPGGEGRGRARHRDGRRPARAPAAHPPRPARDAQGRGARRGGGGDGRGRPCAASACGRCATGARSASRRAWPTRPARWSRSGSTSRGSRASSARARRCCCTGSSGAATSSG